MVTRFFVNVGSPDERMESFLRGFFLRDFNPKNGMNFEEGILKVDLFFEEKPPEGLMETLIAYAGSGQIKSINYLPDAPEVPDEIGQEIETEDGSVAAKEGLVVAEAGLEPEGINCNAASEGDEFPEAEANLGEEVEKSASEKITTGTRLLLYPTLTDKPPAEDCIVYIDELPNTELSISEETASAEGIDHKVEENASVTEDDLATENAPAVEVPVDEVVENEEQKQIPQLLYFKDIRDAFDKSTTTSEFVHNVAILISPSVKGREIFENIVKFSKKSSKLTWRTIENSLKNVDIKMTQADRNALVSEVNARFHMQFTKFIRLLNEICVSSRKPQEKTVLFSCMPLLKRPENAKFIEAFEDTVRNIDKTEPIVENVYKVMHAMGNRLFDGKEKEYNQLIVSSVIDPDFVLERQDLKVRLLLAERVNDLAKKYDEKGKVSLTDFLTDLRSHLINKINK